MIRRLRTRHRRVTTALALVLPFAYSAAILAREPESTWELPPAASPVDPGLPTADRSWGGAPWGGLALEVFFATGPAGTVVQLTPLEPLRRADLLAYWTPAEATDGLPAGAILLGKLGAEPRRFALPRDGGCLTLFDLAHGEVVASHSIGETGE